MSDISRLANPGRLLSALVTSFMLATPHVVIAQDDQPAEDIRAIIEGTWELIEWYVDGQILRPPEMDGRWMVHDGMVIATRHRDGISGYETTAGYGRYHWGATSWTYGYDRSEDRSGTTTDDASLRLRMIPMRTFEITRDGEYLILEDAEATLRWEYNIAEDTFLLMGRDRQPIRRYRRVE